jgi:hypothetical protein
MEIYIFSISLMLSEKMIGDDQEALLEGTKRFGFLKGVFDIEFDAISCSLVCVLWLDY